MYFILAINLRKCHFPCKLTCSMVGDFLKKNVGVFNRNPKAAPFFEDEEKVNSSSCSELCDFIHVIFCSLD